ncbi:hypothetical protein [Kribbella ginsengisoli]|uniref:Uncharacterized protein n=1 Tax=Kribbella ginsengisoli TaxID=363865 RepID=A0ABP6WFR2_9ACTN
MPDGELVVAGKGKVLRGKVAALLNSRELVLNLGADDGVEVGMRFVILNSKGVDITDPDTGEVIGDVKVPKTVVKVVRVDGPKVSVARTFRVIPGTPGIAAALLASGSWAGTTPRVETLAIGPDTELVAELDDNKSYIKVGDTAELTVGDEFDDVK